MPRPPLAPALLLLVSAAASAAVTEHTADLRLGIGAMPGIKQVEVQDAVTPGGVPDTAANGTYDTDSHYGVAFEPTLMFRTPGQGFGLCGGPFIYLQWSHGERSTGAILDRRKVVQYGLGGSFGPSLQIDWLRLELQGLAGLGGAHYRAERRIGSTEVHYNSSTGWSYEYGLRLGAYCDGEQGQVGLQVGWQAFRAQADFKSSSASVTHDGDTEIATGSGVFAAFVAGVAF